METTTFFRAGTSCVWCEKPLYDSQQLLAAGGRTWAHVRCDEATAPEADELVREAVRRVAARGGLGAESLASLTRVATDPDNGRTTRGGVRCWSELLRRVCAEAADELDRLAAPWPEHRAVLILRPRPVVDPAYPADPVGHPWPRPDEGRRGA